MTCCAPSQRFWSPPSSASINWTRSENVRAKMRIEVRTMLARYGYPPDLRRAAVDLVSSRRRHSLTACDRYGSTGPERR